MMWSYHQPHMNFITLHCNYLLEQNIFHSNDFHLDNYFSFCEDCLQTKLSWRLGKISLTLGQNSSQDPIKEQCCTTQLYFAKYFPVSSIQLSSMKELAIHQIIVNCEKCFILLFKMAALFDGQSDGGQETQKIWQSTKYQFRIKIVCVNHSFPQLSDAIFILINQQRLSAF